MEDLVERFAKFLEEESLVHKGDTIVLAVSGGADSMAMLDLFLRIAPDYYLKLVGAHLNHKLRREADEDAEFVESVFRSHGLEVFVKECDVRSLARVEGLSIEEAGRRARYDFFKEVQHETRAASVALAHNLNDLVETIVYRLTRGTGPHGLVAMKPRDGLFIRPLLYFTSSELRSYVTIRRIPYRVDETNFDIGIPRNLIRHLVVTQLRRINPKLHVAFERFHRIMRELMEHVDGEVDGFLNENLRDGFLGLWKELPVKALNTLDAFMLGEILRRLASQVSGKGYGPSFERMKTVVEALKTSDSWMIEVGGGVIFERSGGRLYVSNESRRRDWKEFWVDGEGDFSFGPFKLDVRRVVPDPSVIGTNAFGSTRVWLPAKRGKMMVAKVLSLEESRTHRRRLRDLLRKRGIPKLFRGIWPCVLSEDGEILWIPAAEVWNGSLKDAEGSSVYLMELRGGEVET